MAGIRLFGFQINIGKDKEEEQNLKTFAIPQPDDGAVTIQSGSYYGTYVDLDGIVRNEIELITKYREMALQPELENAIDDVVNEAIVHDDNGQSVSLMTEDIKISEGIKKKIQNEFDHILKLLDFSNMGHEIFRQWYVDGRLFYHVIIDESKPGEGIKELRKIDPRRIRKIREVQKTKDPISGIELVKNVNEYYMYNERGIIGTHTTLGTKIAKDSIINVNSGIMDPRRVMVLSYLHKAIKPLNNLRMVEDAIVIYRMSRAPERRIFYIDVGNMPTVKAEQYLKDIQVKYRNKLVYDANTGEMRDDRKHMSMLEDFWLPRREGSKGTEISTLTGAQNLGELEDVKYFEKKLYKALGIPISRLEQNQTFSLGRVSEVTRDELKFAKSIQKLRNKFSTLFDDALRIQLVLKGICSEDEWDEIREDIWYDFLKDNNFNELKETELTTIRVGLLTQLDPFVGRYFSRAWVKKNVLHFSEKEIKEMEKEMQDEIAQAAEQGVDMQGQPLAPPPGEEGEEPNPADQQLPQSGLQQVDQQKKEADDQAITQAADDEYEKEKKKKASKFSVNEGEMELYR